MKNSEQPAFPIEEWERDSLHNSHKRLVGGLTKREYFASIAMKELCNSMGTDFTLRNAEQIAEASVQYADELLKKLETK